MNKEGKHACFSEGEQQKSSDMQDPSLGEKDQCIQQKKYPFDGKVNR